MVQYIQFHVTKSGT